MFIEVFASSDMLQKSRKYPFVNFYQRLNKRLLNNLWYAITTILQLSPINAYRPFNYLVLDHTVKTIRFRAITIGREENILFAHVNIKVVIQDFIAGIPEVRIIVLLAFRSRFWLLLFVGNVWENWALVQTRAVFFNYHQYYHCNHNYNKILKSDWLVTVLISALIGQWKRDSMPHAQVIGQYAPSHART